LSHSNTDNHKLSLELLHLHMAHEFSDLASICKNVENALGDIISQPDKALDHSVTTLQGLDYLRQSLEDMSRLAQFLSEQNDAVAKGTVRANSVRKQIILSSLSDRLTDQATCPEAVDHDSCDIIWA